MADVFKSISERVQELKRAKCLPKKINTNKSDSSTGRKVTRMVGVGETPERKSEDGISQRTELGSDEKTTLEEEDVSTKLDYLSEKVKPDTPHDESDHATELALVPLTDDPDLPIITIRSLLVGFLMAALGAAITELFLFKPVHMRLQAAFIQIAAMIMGRGFALIPGPKWWNNGPFNIKETVFSSIIATSASAGAFAIELLAARELFFDQVATFGISFGILLSSQLIGYGWAGLLQPLLVYPAHIYYPEVLPSVSLFHSLCGNQPETKDQMKFFKRAFIGMGIYEIFPTYITPALQAISMFCLTLPSNQMITNIFGGAQPFEGLGFLNISMDWSLVGAHGPFFTPLVAQVHHIVGVFLSLFILSFVYTHSWYDSGLEQNFPFMSVSLLDSNGTLYPTKEIINSNGSPNEEAIEKIGLPFFTSTYVVAQIFSSLAMTAAISHALLENYEFFLAFFKKKSLKKTPVDPHRMICRKYKDFPLWGFAAMSVGSIALALGISSLSDSGLPPAGLLFAIFLSGLLTLAVGFLNALTGFHLHVSGVVQMFGGLLFPGNAFGNMWFTTYGASTVIQSMNMLKDLKLGQYMHLPQTSVILGQLFGTFTGIFVNYAVMKIILNSQRDVLLTPHGNGIFSGFVIASFQSQAVSWGAFAQRLFLVDQKYAAIPLALLVGLFLPIPLFVMNRFFPRFKLHLVNIPLLAGSIAMGYSGATAGRFVNIIIGLLSQFWTRRYKPIWFAKYNYVLSAAFDGGAQIMILFLTMVFQGGLGKSVKFPTYFLNPESPMPRDYCYLSK